MKQLKTNKNYLILVMGQVISLFGSAIQRFALSLYLLDLTVNASIPLIVKDDELVAANGVVQQVSSLSNFFEPILAGMLYGLFGIKVIILINGISFFLSAIMELFLVIPYTKPEKVESPWKLFVSEMREGVSYLKQENKHVLRLVEASGLYNLFLVPVFTVCAPYIIKVMLPMSSQVYGVSEGIMAMGMIIGGMIISARPNWLGIQKIYYVSGTMSVVMCVMAFSTALALMFEKNYCKK